MDESLNTQPASRTWNLLGMMNNSIYRVKLSIEASTSAPRKEELPHHDELQQAEEKMALGRRRREQHRLEELHKAAPHVEAKTTAATAAGASQAANSATETAAFNREAQPPPLGLICAHPVLPGKQFGGWLQPEVNLEKERERTSRVAPSAVGAALQAGKLLTLEEVALHNKEDDCWVIINGEVYDVTVLHEGSSRRVRCRGICVLVNSICRVASIMIFAGKDASEIWPHIHSFDAYEIKSWYNIGTIAIKEVAGVRLHYCSTDPFLLLLLLPDGMSSVRAKRESGLHPSRWVDCKLIEKKQETHDTYRFRFQLPSVGCRAPRGSICRSVSTCFCAERSRAN